MKTAMLASIALAFSGFAAAAEPSACAADPAARGMPERVAMLGTYIERIERAVDRVEQRRLMEIHLKIMRENMRELRSREIGAGCRIETMHAMLEQMLRHQLVAQDSEMRSP